MKTFKFIVSYDGSRFAGWQKQRNGQASVQAELEKAFSKILRENVRVVGSGRTDAGVHALGQVAHLKCRNEPPETFKWLRSLDALLPPDIAVTSIEPADKDFHARFDVKRKHYRYRLFTGKVVLPFDRNFVYPVPYVLNRVRMRRATEALIGEHDFAGFARAGHGRKSTVRRIYRAQWTKRGEEFVFDIEGNGFLHMMVRSIVGTLIDIGRGYLAEDRIQRILESGERKLAGATAPAKGLILVKAEYSSQ